MQEEGNQLTHKLSEKTETEFIPISQKKEQLSESKRKEKKSIIFTKNRESLLSSLFNNNVFTPPLQKSTSEDALKKDNEIKIEQVGQELEQFLSIPQNQITNNDIIKFLSTLSVSQSLALSKNYLVEFIKQYNLLYIPKCLKCKQLMKLGTANNLREQTGWRCYSQQCNRSLKYLYHQQLLFENLELSLLSFVKLYLELLPQQAPNNIITQQVTINQQQLSSCRKRWSQIVMNYYHQLYKDIKLGQNGQVIELEEAHFKRKFNRGRIIKRHQWVLGIRERGSKFHKAILIPVENRKAETFIPIFTELVSSNSTLVCSDEWKAYSKLKELGYVHKTVKHKKNFVAHSQADMSQYELYNGHLIHTQSIESKWRFLKQRLQSCQGRRQSYISDVFVCLFYLANKDHLELSSLKAIQQFIISQQYEVNNDKRQILYQDNNQEIIDDAEGDFQDDNFITLNECDIIDGEMDKELQPHEIQEEYELSEQDDMLLSQLLRSINNSNTDQNQ